VFDIINVSSTFNKLLFSFFILYELENKLLKTRLCAENVSINLGDMGKNVSQLGM